MHKSPLLNKSNRYLFIKYYFIKSNKINFIHSYSIQNFQRDYNYFKVFLFRFKKIHTNLHFIQ